MSRQPTRGNQAQRLSEIEKAYLNRALLALEGARNIQENDQATQIIFQNTGLTQATQNYLLQHYQQLILETTATRRNPKNQKPRKDQNTNNCRSNRNNTSNSIWTVHCILRLRPN